MKKTIFITLLLTVAAFSFSQTNATFKNLDVRNDTKIRHELFLTDSTFNMRLGWLLGWEHTTGKVFVVPMSSIADSIVPLMSGYWVRDTVNGYIYTADTTDKVGIGTTTPTEMLDVNGSINISTTTSTAGQIKQDGYTIFHTYTDDIYYPNLFIGESSGNLYTTGNWNIGIGKQVLTANTTGFSNIGIGGLTTNTTGYCNTEVGMSALGSNTEGNFNTAFGSASLGATTIGSNNTAIGVEALSTNIGNSGSTAVGYMAMQKADSRSSGRNTYNTAIGYEAMKGSSTAANNTGQYNTAVGYQSLDAMTSGGNNTALGMWSLTGNTTGNRNVAIGSYAQVNGSMSDNVAIGYDAFDNANDGKSVGIGSYAGTGATGGNNIIIGYEAGKENTGNNLTIVGYQAGFTGDGDSSIFIGNKAGYNETGSNKLYIENSNSATPLIYGDFAADSVVVNGDLTVTGQIKYDFKHLVAYLTAGSYTPNVATNTPFKLAPGMTVTENDGLTFAGDSITIITPGDYKLDIAGVASAESANWKLTVKKNGATVTSGHCAWTSTGSTIYDNFSWFYYLPGLVAGDDLSFYITNETGSNDPTFRSFKIFLEMKPE